MDTSSLIRGVCPVLETPFEDDGTIDVTGFRSVVEHVLDAGASAVMYPGFASEFHKLDDDERQTLVAELLRVTRRRRDTAAIVAVQQHATVLAVRTARRAVDDGADAINLLPPHLFGPSRRDILDHVSAVLDAVAPTPVILQYAPAQTGTALDAPALLALRDDHPNLRFVKVEASLPGPLIEDLGSARRPLPALVGLAGLLLPDAVRRGAVGVQPGCSFTELYADVWALYEAGRTDEADRLHARLLPYLAYWMQSVETIVAVEKLISHRRGWIVSPYCRNPGRTLDTAELAQVDRFLAEFGDRLAVRAPGLVGSPGREVGG
ncbi:MAG TPA: dihydrodipicolinate synthase family protein [Streptosporangiales bacterium]